MTGRWLPRAHPRAEARLRLFLFPYAGGSASLFRNWSGAFPSTVDVLPVQLPGREERIGETAFSQMEALADTVADALFPLVDRPAALFGWSMGAALAYEVARRWERLGRIPDILIPAAHPAPHLPLRASPLHHLPSDLFWQELARMGGLPEEVLTSRDLRDCLEPTLRADLTAVETRPPAEQHVLSCRITAVVAEGDRSVALEDMLAWAEATRGTTRLGVVKGDHFAVRDDRSSVIAAILEALNT
jgi:surfactin synthase thioesterase subunit